MEKRPQAEYIDDGRTVADMSADWMPWNRGLRRRRREAKRERSKEEVAEAKKTFRAAVKGQYLAMLPFWAASWRRLRSCIFFSAFG